MTKQMFQPSYHIREHFIAHITVLLGDKDPVKSIRRVKSHHGYGLYCVLSRTNAQSKVSLHTRPALDEAAGSLNMSNSVT